MKISDEKLAELERKAPKAREGLSKIHGMAMARNDDERRGFCYMSIPANPEHDADLLISDVLGAVPDLIADLREANAAIELSHGVNQTYAEGELAARVRAEKAEAERDRLREALRRGVQAVEHNERGDVRIDGRWTERDCIVSEMRAALAKVKP